MTKGEWVFTAGFATGLGLGIALCFKGIFGGEPRVNPFPQPTLPGLYGYDELLERDWASLGPSSRYGARGFGRYR